MVRGELPAGLELDASGVISGVATQGGEFPIIVAITDGGTPAHQRNQAFVLRVVVPLLAQWSRLPAITGSQIEGAIKVSNQTEQDFDLTVIALAVDAIGRATAVGYQHLTLKPDTTDLEIPLHAQLPPGEYFVNVDIVAEVPSLYRIHRQRLVSERLLVAQGP